MRRSTLAALAALVLAPNVASAGLPEDRAVLEAARAALAGKPGAGDRLAKLDHALRQPDWPTTGRFIAVNVAEGVVRGYDDGRQVFESRAIVGKTSSRTPRFRADAVSVTLNPSWTTPPGIARSEYGGVKTTIPPGPKNPLGHVRVDMPNGHAVFLHSTNQPHLFDRTDRHTFSHGCIRVRDAVGLARWLVGEDAWRAADGDGVVKGWRQRRIALAEAVPVLIEYRAATVGADGRPEFHKDVYGIVRAAGAAD